jgi:hypothetical protein
MSSSYQIGTPFDATVVTQTVLVVPYVNSFFIVNDGSVSVTYSVYGSPDGAKAGNKDSDGNALTAADIAKRWILIETNSVSSNKSINVADKPYKYFRIDVQASSGTVPVRVWTNLITKISGFF